MATLTVKAVEEQLREYKGNMAAVARVLGVTRQSVFDYCKKRPTLQSVMLDCREIRVDNAESGLDKAVDNGEAWAISLTLKTIGKSRGYIERTETQLLGGLEVVEELLDASSTKDNPAPPGTTELPPQ